MPLTLPLTSPPRTYTTPKAVQCAARRLALEACPEAGGGGWGLPFPVGASAGTAPPTVPYLPA